MLLGLPTSDRWTVFLDVDGTLLDIAPTPHAVRVPEGLVATLTWEGDVDLENAQMIASLPFINTGEDYIGWMRPDLWAGMDATMREQGVLTGTVAVADVYTLDYLKDIYER